MASPTVDDLAEWVKTRETTKKPRQDKNLVAFLAVKVFVKDSLDAGFSVLTIWEHLHEKGYIAYSYETFLKHVRRHVKAKQRTSEVKPTPTSPIPIAAETRASKTHPPEPVPAPAPPKQLEVTGFTFNPTPNKEDYI